MVNVSFDENEIAILIMSLEHCMETCKHGGKATGCTDCEKVERILNKIRKFH